MWSNLEVIIFWKFQAQNLFKKKWIFALFYILFFNENTHHKQRKKTLVRLGTMQFGLIATHRSNIKTLAFFFSFRFLLVYLFYFLFSLFVFKFFLFLFSLFLLFLLFLSLVFFSSFSFSFFFAFVLSVSPKR